MSPHEPDFSWGRLDPHKQACGKGAAHTPREHCAAAGRPLAGSCSPRVPRALTVASGVTLEFQVPARLRCALRSYPAPTGARCPVP